MHTRKFDKDAMANAAIVAALAVGVVYILISYFL